MDGENNFNGWTRRDFMRGAAGAAMAGLIGIPPATAAQVNDLKAAGAAPWLTSDRSRVVLIRNEKVLDDKGRIDHALMEKMLDEALCALLDEADPSAAWKRIVRPDDIVGIKSNHSVLRIPTQFEEAIRRRVVGAGVPEKQVDVADRDVLSRPLFLKSTALINVRPIRTHLWSGIGTCVKNYIMFSPDPASWHDDSCAGLAGLWDLPVTKGKTRLNVMVLMTPLFNCKGAQLFNPTYTWPYKGLLVGLDPVAVDSTGLRILEAKRLEYFGKYEAFGISPKHVRMSQDRYRLGIADPARIDLVKLGWTDGIYV